MMHVPECCQGAGRWTTAGVWCMTGGQEWAGQSVSGVSLGCYSVLAQCLHGAAECRQGASEVLPCRREAGPGWSTWTRSGLGAPRSKWSTWTWGGLWAPRSTWSTWTGWTGGASGEQGVQVEYLDLGVPWSSPVQLEYLDLGVSRSSPVHMEYLDWVDWGCLWGPRGPSGVPGLGVDWGLPGPTGLPGLGGLGVPLGCVQAPGAGSRPSDHVLAGRVRRDAG